MSRKPHITKTLGPIHFEDLDPHRFEDMVRQLIYDFRDWQTIEAIGRSGSDEGFDARAYEKVSTTPTSDAEEDIDSIPEHPMDGNIWMIQGKREKEIGPARLKKILEDVDSENPPYGYILAASADFSKESRDTFRSILREKGVVEFHLWGRGELEDMLHQPKNDRILFTFFGISLVSRRRTRTTEIRQIVVIKNRLQSLFNADGRGISPVLLRDSNDTNYPYEDGYKDFKQKPRWKEYEVVALHALGLVVRTREQYAYLNVENKEYDRTDTSDLIYRTSDSDEDRESKRIQNERVEDYWEHLPAINKAKYYRNGLVRFEDILVVDPKGDSSFNCPHVFIDFDASGPFSGGLEYLQRKSRDEQIFLNDYKRIEKFPKKFSAPKIGKVHAKEIVLSAHTLDMLRRGSDRLNTLFDCGDIYPLLKPREIIIVGSGTEQDKTYLQITHSEKMGVAEYLKKYGEHLMWDIEHQLGRKPEPEEELNAYEFKRTYDFVIERMKKSGR